MRPLKHYSIRDWIRLGPVRDAATQWRNDAIQGIYRLAFNPEQLDRFLEANRMLAGGNVVAIIAFGQPWALDWLLAMAARNLADASPLVFDNSRQNPDRKAIAAVCQKHGTAYLELPPNPTRHANRSHGMAMTWVYHRIFRALRPRRFAFVDHDLIPVRPVELARTLGEQPFYGLAAPGRIAGAWQLWAGYCLFDFAALGGRPLNFLYDFSMGLDTGGRLWSELYRRHDPRSLRLAGSVPVTLRIPGTDEIRSTSLVDGQWLHLHGISYNGNFRMKAPFCERLRQAAEQEGGWDAVCEPTARICEYNLL
jgi:hypothetical protein